MGQGESAKDSMDAYRLWVCSQLFPFYAGGRHILPCLAFCRAVEQRCPYLHPLDKPVAGEPTFLCQDPGIGELEDQVSSYGQPDCCYRNCSADVTLGRLHEDSHHHPVSFCHDCPPSPSSSSSSSSSSTSSSKKDSSSSSSSSASTSSSYKSSSGPGKRLRREVAAVETVVVLNPTRGGGGGGDVEPVVNPTGGGVSTADNFAGGGDGGGGDSGETAASRDGAKTVALTGGSGPTEEEEKSAVPKSSGNMGAVKLCWPRVVLSCILLLCITRTPVLLQPRGFT
ncbi:uncharacterized protein LOC143018357 [Oratosquilla oratoria]|uniref:uncharacterized protein LOC143018357 n=1 Tax=Oratosquilla oratoria TaxID=337810 RepID=UPI003F760996